MDNVMNKLTYGLFVLSVNCHKRDNACIINTATQVTTTPNVITIAVNKANLTEEILHYTDDFTLSILAEDADFSLFTRFGFQSGRDVEKFDGFDDCVRTSNGAYAVTAGTNGYLCAHVVERIDRGTHTLFVAEVTDQQSLSDVPSASYAYYHSHIKPKPPEKKSEKTVWRCTVCGYEYEGEELPDDFVCPLCHHGKADFEKIG